MGGYVDKLAKQVGGHLQPGERVVGAVRTQPRGSTVSMGVGGLVGEAISARQAKKAHSQLGEDTIASQWPSGRFAVALTDRRLLTFSYTAMGKAKDLTSQMPLDQLASVDVEKKGITNRIRFGFVDGSGIEVECAKLEKVGDFEDAFRSVKGGLSPA